MMMNLSNGDEHQKSHIKSFDSFCSDFEHFVKMSDGHIEKAQRSN